MLLGRVSTNTIAGGIADINAFTAAPEVYAYGEVRAPAAADAAQQHVGSQGIFKCVPAGI